MLSRTRRVLTLAAVSVLTAAGMSACASAGSSTTSTSAAAGSIKIYSIYTEGSPVSYSGDAPKGAKAAVQAINAAGGINGHPIDLVECNTRGDANQAATCARQAQSDGAVAVVGGADIFSTQTTPLYATEQIPLVGTVPYASIDYTSPDSFPTHSGTFGSLVAGPTFFQKKGMTSMVFARVDHPSTVSQSQLITAVANKIGLKIAPDIVIPIQGVTDYSPYAQQIKDSGAQGVVLSLGAAGSQALFKSMVALGVNAQVAFSPFAFGQGDAQQIGTAADGRWAVSPLPAPNDTSNKGVALYQQELTDSGVAANDPDRAQTVGLSTWLAVYAFAKVADTITGPVTSASVTSALQSASNVDVQGILTWSPASLGSADLGQFPRFAPSAYQLLTFQNGNFVAGPSLTVADPFATIRQ